MIDVRVLGLVEVRDGAGRSIDLGSPKQRAVLALLALHPGRVVATDRIAFELWGDGAPRTAANTIQAYVSRLRAAVGAEVIVTRPPGYALDVETDNVDAWRFERLVQEARDELDDGNAEAAAGRSREALALWRGEAFGDVDGVPGCEQEAARLEDVKAQALEDRIDADLALGRHVDVAAELPRVIALHPFRERLYAQRMLALYRCGRQADALAVFAELRERLVGELGIDPSPDVRGLERAILEQDPSLDWTQSVVSGHVEERPPRNVPEPLTSFIGRERELVDIAELLEATRLLTLTGHGGCGKTRLAIESVRSLEDVWFVPLASITSPTLVAQQLAAAIGVRASHGLDVADALISRLRNATGVLVVDNCEHVLRSAAETVHALLGACSGVRVLATSRATLGVSGEMVYRVPPLPLPRDEDTEPLTSPAVKLFVERARSVDVRFDASGQDHAIVDVCRRLDGIPLAIELAAARCDVLRPAEIGERLDDVLSLLTTGGLTDEAHHRTLRAALDWSYDTLTDDERSVFEATGVFAGGFTLADADAVIGRDVIDEVSKLVSMSLLDASRDEGSKRFIVLETVRQFALDKLAQHGRVTAIRDRHLKRFAEIVANAAGTLTGEGIGEAADSLEPDLPNIRAALSWAIEDQRDVRTGLTMARSLIPLWQLRGYGREGRRSFEALLAVLERGTTDFVEALLGAAAMCREQSDLAAARGYLDEAVELATETADAGAAARAYVALAGLYHISGEIDRSDEVLERAIEIARREGERRTLFHAFRTQGYARIARGDHEGARAVLEEALELAREIGDPRASAQVTLRLGQLERYVNNLEEARTLFEDSLAVSRRINDLDGTCNALTELGNTCLYERDYVGGREYYTEALPIAKAMGDDNSRAKISLNLGSALRQIGELDDARSWYLDARAIQERLGQPLTVAKIDLNLGGLFILKGDHRRAARCLLSAIRPMDELATPHDVAVCLEQIGGLAMIYGEREVAARLYGAGRRLRRESGARPRPYDPQDDPESELELVELERGQAVADAVRWLETARRHVPASPAQTS